MISVGIDLGTTNSVLASCAVSETGAGAAPAVLPVPQVTAANVVESRDVLPSFCYLAPEGEAGALALPWDDSPGYAVGEYARRRAAEAPDRVVGTAKSWLGHAGVDRRQPILPWDAPQDVGKISPVEASARYLRHLAAAWDAAHPEAPFREQTVTLTVPASFDAAARDLTRDAARQAGLPDSLVLLEEPQAAVYAHLADRGEDWRKDLSAGDALLVVDVGGGTTDFSLISVTDREGDLELERVAVGRHLLVGGDNMDLALAHHAAGLLQAKGVTPDPWQSVALWHACRTAKETLLGHSPDEQDAPDHAPVAVLGRGRKLIGGTVSVDLAASDVRALVLDGFFPEVAAAARPQAATGGGFVQLGLPYESDPAVTKHLAAFLAKHPDVVPTHLLLNGGAFRSAPLRGRLRSVLASWLPHEPVLLERPAAALDHAVARGAAFYGATKQSGGLRIRGGTGRSYYVGIETAGLAIPGAPRPLSALCVVPQGMEEGTETAVPVERLPGGGVGVTVGRPARFRFFASPSRPDDRPGDLLSRWTEDELEETDPIETTLDPTADGSGDAAEGDVIPVNFHAAVTELGELSLSARQTNGEGAWTLGFDVREP